MLNETASTRSDHVAPRAPQAPLSREEILHNEIRQMVATVLLIEKEAFVESEQSASDSVGLIGVGTQLVATFEGTLLTDSETAYDKLDALLANVRHLALFREVKPAPGEPPNPAIQHAVHIITGRVNPAPPRPWWPNLLLLIATFFSVLLVGAGIALGQIMQTDGALAQQLQANPLSALPYGLPYALSILLILGAHELGHYFAARRHKLGVTLPYFIPLPILSQFGTMGAFIQLRQPMKNRKMLLDVGAAGPLTGLIFAIPILLIGLAQSPLMSTAELRAMGDPDAPLVYEGDSLFYMGAKILRYGRPIPDGDMDVCIGCNQLAWAGWTGLLVTALNLIPVGQLDGGHVLYSLIGERARRLYFPFLFVMVGLALLTEVWLIWVVLLFIFGRVYATPLDMITPLDRRRQIIAVLSMVVFVLIFVPAPLQVQAVNQPLPPVLPPRDSASLLPMLGAMVIVLWGRLRR
jgi:Zn-dependent protease